MLLLKPILCPFVIVISHASQIVPGTFSSSVASDGEGKKQIVLPCQPVSPKWFLTGPWLLESMPVLPPNSLTLNPNISTVYEPKLLDHWLLFLTHWD